MLIIAITFLCISIAMVAWISKIAMKTVDVRFTSGFSIQDSIHRLSMICMPFNFSTRQMRWIFGSVTESKVVLECRTHGVKRSFTQFYGAFRSEESMIVLTGKFVMSSRAQLSLALWFSALGFGFVFLARELVARYNQSLLVPMLFVSGMIVFTAWIIKIRIIESPDEMKFISSEIENTLRAI